MQAIGQLKEVVRVNGQNDHGVGGGEMSAPSEVVFCGEMGKGLCVNLIQPLLENINRESRNDAS